MSVSGPLLLSISSQPGQLSANGSVQTLPGTSFYYLLSDTISNIGQNSTHSLNNLAKNFDSADTSFLAQLISQFLPQEQATLPAFSYNNAAAFNINSIQPEGAVNGLSSVVLQNVANDNGLSSTSSFNFGLALYQASLARNSTLPISREGATESVALPLFA